MPHYSAVQNGIVNEYTSKIDCCRAIFVLGVWFFDQTNCFMVWDKNCSKNYNFCSRKMCCTILETRDRIPSSNMSKFLIRLHIFEKMGWSKLRVSPCRRNSKFHEIIQLLSYYVHTMFPSYMNSLRKVQQLKWPQCTPLDKNLYWQRGSKSRPRIE